MTPQDYIKKHCIISSRRQTLYQKIFLKNKDKSQAIVFKVSERQSTVKPDFFISLAKKVLMDLEITLTVCPSKHLELMDFYFA